MISTMKKSTKTIKSYSEMILLPSFKERFEYLRCNGIVGLETFGNKRYLNQILYHLVEWRSFRNKVIYRDEGFDLGDRDIPIYGPIYIHHINPITIDDILQRRKCVFDMDNAISTSFRTHQAIHYETDCPLLEPAERHMNDTCPWLL